MTTKIVEWELTMKCNYSCDYCGLLDNGIHTETDEGKLKNFMDALHEEYPDVELFLFGGEPFLHPKIEFIISYLLSISQPFVVQTNFSKLSVSKMRKMDKVFNINISIHPDEVAFNDVVDAFNIQLPVIINSLDVMYIGKKSLTYYTVIKKVRPDLEPTLTPLVNIGCSGYDNVLAEYNEIKHKTVYKKVYNFDDVMGNVTGEEEERSIIWEKFNSREYTTINKPCLYTDRYILFDASLKRYNCCYRTNNTGICQNEVCFLM